MSVIKFRQNADGNRERLVGNSWGPFEQEAALLAMNQRQNQDPFQGESRRGRIEAIRQSWGGILLAVGLIFLLVGAGLLATRAASGDALLVEAHVLRFGSYATDVGDKPLIVIKLQDGTVKPLHVRRPQLQTCRKGDRIQLIEKGHMLFVHPRACLRDKHD